MDTGGLAASCLHVTIAVRLLRVSSTGYLARRVQRLTTRTHLWWRRSFPGLPTANISQQLFTDVLTRALTELYGLIGGAVPFTLLEFSRGRGILQLDKGCAKYAAPINPDAIRA